MRLEPCECRQLLAADLSFLSFTSDGTNLTLTYNVANEDSAEFNVGVYASVDGATLGELLSTVRITSAAARTLGNGHTVSISPTFASPEEDFQLVAKLDSSAEVAEANEANNQGAFAGGVFRDANGLIQVHGTASADTVTVSQSSAVDVVFNSATYSYASGSTNGVRLRLHGGNDLLNAAASLTKPIAAFGGAGADTLYGGQGGDTLNGGAGDDVVYAGYGSDILRGDAGADLLYGEDGNDSLFGGDGNDNLFGGSGNDAMYGGAANDLIFGGDGADWLEGGAGADSLHGDAGSDAIYGGATSAAYGGDDGYGGYGADVLYGDDGNDSLYCGYGGDGGYGGYGGYGGVAYGGYGDDTLAGGVGNDTLFGDEGNDSLDAGAGNDNLFGGGGNDTCYGGAGDDQITGGEGVDSINGGGQTNDVVNDKPTVAITGYEVFLAANLIRVFGQITDDASVALRTVTISGIIGRTVTTDSNGQFEFYAEIPTHEGNIYADYTDPENLAAAQAQYFYI